MFQCNLVADWSRVSMEVDVEELSDRGESSRMSKPVKSEWVG